MGKGVVVYSSILDAELEVKRTGVRGVIEHAAGLVRREREKVAKAAHVKQDQVQVRLKNFDPSGGRKLRLVYEVYVVR